jgi:hypothetical protein
MNSIKTLLSAPVRLCALASILLGLAFTSPAQVTPVSIQPGLSNMWVMTNFYFLVATNAYPCQLQNGKGVGVMTIGGGTGLVTTGQFALRFTLSADGTNWCNDTNVLPTLWFQPEGAKRVVAFTNFPPWVVDNCRYMKLYDVTNANLLACTGLLYWITNVMYIIKN